MKRKNALPELLAPAGSFECLLAAIESGADAVYIGGKRFGARAYAKNFDIEEIGRAVRYAHLHGRRIYVTLNTLTLDKELHEVLDYARELYAAGVDALIIADIGALLLIREHLPDFELHASTQMSVHNSLGADAAYEIGCTRVVLARELSREDIASVTEKCKSETEVFLHGALCVCHSGQCLFSSMVGGRSGNRGECAQPCRLPYNGADNYPLSLRDLSLANHISELCDSGVASLKIEGRMKSPEYVYAVTSIYRRLLDEKREADESENARLRAAFSRGDFTDKYFEGKNLEKMTGTRGEEEKKASRELAAAEYKIQKTKVTASARIELGKPSVLTLKNERKSVTVSGAVTKPAENSPLTESDVKLRLSKMGATMLSLDICDIELVLDEGVNLSPAELNALRRDAADAFESCRRILPEEKESAGKDRPFSEEKSAKALATIADKARGGMTSALFLNIESYREARAQSPERIFSLDHIFLPLMNIGVGDERLDPSADGKHKSKMGVYLPPVIMEHEIDEIRKKLIFAKNNGYLYALVGNIGHISLAKEIGLIPFGDFRLNITNSKTRDFYTSAEVESKITSPELTLPQARDIGGFTVQMGRIPLMLTERCFIKENFGCEGCGKTSLEDRMGEKFPLIREYEHRNLIMNSRPTYMGDKKAELRAAGLRDAHFIFSVEGGDEIISCLEKFDRGLPFGSDVRRLGKREFIREKDAQRRKSPSHQDEKRKAPKNSAANSKAAPPTAKAANSGVNVKTTLHIGKAAKSNAANAKTAPRTSQAVKSGEVNAKFAPSFKKTQKSNRGQNPKRGKNGKQG